MKDGSDDDLTLEPETLKAFRDTWELGIHSYLTYLRDRLLLAKELLHESGSCFVQINDENLHHVRSLMDEVFGSGNFVAVIAFRTTAAFYAKAIATNSDFVVWYAKAHDRVKTRPLYRPRTIEDDIGGRYTRVELTDGTRRVMTTEERRSPTVLPSGSRIYRHDNLTPTGETTTSSGPFEFKGFVFSPGPNRHWKTPPESSMPRCGS